MSTDTKAMTTATASGEQIRVLVVDDNSDTISNLKKLLYFEKDINVIAVALSGEEGIRLVEEHHPDIVLMDINMPGMDGIAATEAIAARAPGVQIVIMSVQAEADYLKRAMLAGAREFLVKPFGTDDLTSALRKVHALSASQFNISRETPSDPSGAVSATRPVSTRPVSKHTQQWPEPTPIQVQTSGAMGHPNKIPVAPSTATATGKVLVIFSANGGMGRSTIAANLAIALKEETKGSVALVDCSLRFGDIGVLLNLTSPNSIADLCSAEGNVDTEIIADLMPVHSTGVKVLLAPASPEMADVVTAKALRQIFSVLRSSFDYVIVDTFTSLDEAMLTVLDMAEQILLITTSEIPSIKNTKLFFEVTEALHYPDEKTLLLLNKADSKNGITPQDIEASVKHPVFATIVRDDRATTHAVQMGQPFVASQKNAPISQSIYRLAKLIGSPQTEPAVEKAAPVRRAGLFR